VSADPTPAATALRELAQDAACGATEIVPRLLERSREQLRFAARVVSQLPCVGNAVPSSLTEESPAPDQERTAPIGSEAGLDGHDGSIRDAASMRPQSGPDATSLAITDYDSLAASQVLPRLDGLTTEELEAVRRYESEHRGRRTILGRIAQLQA
jgi:hypothetical protein